jgi:hypothetical protein
MVELRASTSTATPPTEVLDPAAPEQLGPSGPRIRADPRWRRPSVSLAQGHLMALRPHRKQHHRRPSARRAKTAKSAAEFQSLWALQALQ